MGKPSLLVVEDDPSARDYLALVLREGGYDVRVSSDGLEAILAAEDRLPDLVLSDLRMPEIDGLELILHLQGRWPGLPVVITSVVEEIATVVEAVQRGAVNYLVKPASPAAILNAVGKALAARPRDAPRQGHIPEILGKSRAIVEVRRLVALAASTDVNVLIVGETGVGKELVARAIQRHSRLVSGPFVGHNCAATPGDLFESQFFGHRRGAFTGAVADHVGLFEQADGGVLLLDELEALSIPNQAKLLRVLDDGEVRPVGSKETRSVAVRCLAATNRRPADLIAMGTLRDDLYYRLRGLEIRVPPLRERREDIPILARHFLGAGASLSPEALEALWAFGWPGNVRELRNVVQSAGAAASRGRVEVHHLPLDRPQGPSDAREGRAEAHPETRSEPQADALPIGALPQPLAETERKAILDTLRLRGGNISRAARDLGIHRSTLRRKLHELYATPEPHTDHPPEGPFVPPRGESQGQQ